MLYYKKYLKALNDIKKYFLVDLAELNIEAAQIYGSSTYSKGFIPGVSDIDICIYTKKMDNMPLKDIVEIISKTDNQFKDKFPVIINDHIARRIEFYYKHTDILFDITILYPELPRADLVETTSSYDSLDMIIGALYQHGVPLIGQIPDKDLVEEKFLPFYNDELRKKRLDVLTKRVTMYTTRIDQLLSSKDEDIFDHVYKTRNHFIKWLFLYKRKYPVNTQKHLTYQLNNILSLTHEEMSTLLFTGNGDFYELTNRYIILSKKYFSEYEKEQRKV